jgi:pimeloyl-ACP methyl ester carboxylesterase
MSTPATFFAAGVEYLPKIGAPTLVVVGADDRPFPAAANYMAAKIPDAELAVLTAPATLPTSIRSGCLVERSNISARERVPSNGSRR